VSYILLRWGRRNVSPNFDKKTKKVGRKIITNKEITTFFDNLPTLPSHYCRSISNKMYLESFFGTKLSLYNAYVVTLHNNDNAVKTNFFKEFQRRNLALYSPKKDLCDLCEGYKYKSRGMIIINKGKRMLEIQKIWTNNLL